jgi:hypothetical protein
LNRELPYIYSAGVVAGQRGSIRRPVIRRTLALRGITGPSTSWTSSVIDDGFDLLRRSPTGDELALTILRLRRVGEMLILLKTLPEDNYRAQSLAQATGPNTNHPRPGPRAYPSR